MSLHKIVINKSNKSDVLSKKFLRLSPQKNLTWKLYFKGSVNFDISNFFRHIQIARIYSAKNVESMSCWYILSHKNYFFWNILSCYELNSSLIPKSFQEKATAQIENDVKNIKAWIHLTVAINMFVYVV